MSSPSRSLEERVTTTARRLVLIHAALNAPEDVALDDAVLAAAVAEIAEQAYADIAPLVDAPGDIANWEPNAQSGNEGSDGR